MAAINDTTADLQSIANGARLTIQPPAGEEWAIINIKYGGAVAIHTTDGILDLTYDTDTGVGARLGYALNVTNTIWLEVENTSGSDIIIGFDGVVTKVA